jgi:TonB family protein
VRILEAPAQPEARALELSTDAISALKLESPSLSTDAPPPAPPPPEEAEVPAAERFPSLAPPSAARPSLTPPQAPAAPAPPEPAPPASSAAPGAARELPRLPGVPAPRPPAAAPRPPAAAPRPPAAPSPGARSVAPPLPGVEEPERQSAMERLRSKVRTLDLQVEAAPPERPATAAAPAREQNVLALRLYSNRVREAVKEQYAFPGGFAPGLRTRVRVTLNRDGSVRATEILESSGNDRFDQLVCLAAIRNAKIPPVPQAVEGEGDTLRLHFTCSP